MWLLQGDTSDYELIKHQLSDPDIKASNVIVFNRYFNVSTLTMVKLPRPVKIMEHKKP